MCDLGLNTFGGGAEGYLSVSMGVSESAIERATSDCVRVCVCVCVCVCVVLQDFVLRNLAVDIRTLL